jgi:hypothetical protein
MSDTRIKPAAFMSYAHKDNRHGQIELLRDNLEEAVSLMIGDEFKIFLDRRSIGWGDNWSRMIDESINDITFFIPILTPSFFKSDNCREELEKFLERERSLDRSNLILPIYYIDSPLLNKPDIRINDELASIIATHQYIDWREFRHESYESIKVKKMLDKLAVRIRDALDDGFSREDRLTKPEDTISNIDSKEQLSRVKKIDFPPIIRRDSSNQYYEEKFSILQEGLAIETLGGIATRLIERNTILPTSKSQIFTTAADNQTSVEVNVLQGERPMAKDNTSLGRFTLAGIPPSRRGIPQIEVTFDINANGIINVSARELATNKEQKIAITAPPKLSKQEIEAKIKEAERFSKEDAKRLKEINAKNQADSLIYASEKMMEEAGDSADEVQKEKIQNKITDLKNALAGGSVNSIMTKTEALQNDIYELSAKMYQKAAKK